MIDTTNTNGTPPDTLTAEKFLDMVQTMKQHMVPRMTARVFVTEDFSVPARLEFGKPAIAGPHEVVLMMRFSGFESKAEALRWMEKNFPKAEQPGVIDPMKIIGGVT